MRKRKEKRYPVRRESQSQTRATVLGAEGLD